MTQLIKRLTVTAFCLALTATMANAQTQKIYVPNYGEGSVTVIDPATNQVSDTISLSGAGSGAACASSVTLTTTCPEGIALVNGRAFVSLDLNDRVAVIDLSTNAVTYLTVPQRFDPLIYYEPVRNRVYVTSCAWDPSLPTFDDERQIVVIDPAVPAVVDTIETGAGVFGMAFSPDGQYIHGVKCGASDTDPDPPDSVLKIDVDTHLYTAITLSKTLSGIGISPTGTTAILTGSDCVVRLNLLTDTEDGTTCGFGFSWYGVEFSADGSRAYVTDNATNELVVIDPNAPVNPAELSRTLLTAPGFAADLAVVGLRAYVLACEACYADLPSHVVEFDISTDNPVQLCSLANGLGGFDIAVDGAPVWNCTTPPDDGSNKKVHGEGRIAPRIDFEVTAMRRNDKVKGQCHVHDHPSRRHDRKIQCINVTSLTVVGNMAIIEGEAYDSELPKKEKTLYRIEVEDNAKHGRGEDTFSITTASGFAADGVLTKGNIWIKSHWGDEDDD